MGEYLFNRNSLWRPQVLWSKNMCFYAFPWVFGVLLNTEFALRKKIKLLFYELLISI